MTETAVPAAPPAVVVDYFLPVAHIAPAPYSAIALFTPGRGWFNLPLDTQVPITADWARGALAAGAVSARIGASGFYADFQLSELV